MFTIDDLKEIARNSTEITGGDIRVIVQDHPGRYTSGQVWYDPRAGVDPQVTWIDVGDDGHLHTFWCVSSWDSVLSAINDGVALDHTHHAPLQAAS